MKIKYKLFNLFGKKRILNKTKAVFLKLIKTQQFKPRLKFRSVCQGHQARENTVKYPSQVQNKMERVGFEPRSYQSQSRPS